jgi:hypothetical protein
MTISQHDWLTLRPLFPSVVEIQQCYLSLCLYYVVFSKLIPVLLSHSFLSSFLNIQINVAICHFLEIHFTFQHIAVIIQ